MPSAPAGAIDKRIGLNLRTKRLDAALSQEQLGSALGVTFQQVQKYERGVNRCPASTLYLAARAIGCPVADFYAGLGASAESPACVTPPPHR